MLHDNTNKWFYEKLSKRYSYLEPNGFNYKKYIEGPYEDRWLSQAINDFTEYQLTQENKIERVFNPHDFKKDNF